MRRVMAEQITNRYELKSSLKSDKYYKMNNYYKINWTDK